MGILFYVGTITSTHPDKPVIDQKIPLSLRYRLNNLEKVSLLVVATLVHGEVSFVYLSSQIAVILGYRSEEPLRNQLQGIITPNWYPRVTGELRDALLRVDQGTFVYPTERDVPIRSKDGRIFELAVTCFCFECEGSPIAIIQTCKSQLEQVLTPEPLPDRCHAFVSYARSDLPKDIPTDQSKPYEFVRLAKRRGLNCWLDVRSLPLTPDFRVEIEKTILQCDRLIFFAGPYAALSKWCRTEVDIALRLGKQVIVIQIDEGGLPIHLTERQWTFLYPNRANEWAHVVEHGQNVISEKTNAILRRTFPEEIMNRSHYIWDDPSIDATYGVVIDNVLNEIKTYGSQAEAHTQLLVRATRWWESGRLDKYLLRSRHFNHVRDLFECDGMGNTITELQLDYLSSSIVFRQGGADVFISSGEGQLLEEVGRELKLAGLGVIQSQTGVMTSERFSISRPQIDHCANFVLIGHRSSLRDEATQQEITHAIEQGKPLIILICQDNATPFEQDFGSARLIHYGVFPTASINTLIDEITHNRPTKLQHGALLDLLKDYRRNGALISPIDASMWLQRYSKNNELFQARLNSELENFLRSSQRRGRLLGFISHQKAELVIVLLVSLATIETILFVAFIIHSLRN